MNEPEEILKYFKHFSEDAISLLHNFINEREVGAEDLVIEISKHYSTTPEKINSIDDNILESGIDSLSLLEIVILLQGCLERTISDEELKSWNSLRDIANLLNDSKKGITSDVYTNCGLVRRPFPKTEPC